MLVTGVLAVIRNDGRPAVDVADGRRTAAEHRNGLCFHFSARRALARPMPRVTAQMLIAVCRVAYFFTRKTALRFDLQMFKLKPKYLKNAIVSGFPSLGNQLSIIAMLFFHNYQALKYGRVDGGRLYLYRRGRIAPVRF